jgi:hypothetical protein
MARLSFTRRGSAIDFALAGFAGAAFAFAAFFLPEWRLTQLSLASGLADIFPPARPPLGFTARALFAIVVGLVAGGGSLLLLRLADRKPAPKREATEADAPPEPIRLRRADAHPDAPPRRPFAARDLGEPVEPQALLAATPPEPAEELVLAPEAELPAFLVEQAPETDAPEVLEPEPETPLVWPAAQPAPEPEVLAEPEPEPKPEPEPAPQSEDEASLAKLMQRLEFGVAKRERAAPLDPAAVAAPADAAVGHRLRSAIGDLQKLAARG